jgi:hypothetical protein
MAWWELIFPKPSRQRFAKAVAKRLRRESGVASVEVDAEKFMLQITSKTGKTSQASLTNLFMEVTSLPPWERAAAIDRLTRVFDFSDAAPKSRDEFCANLLVSVKDAIYFEDVNSMAPGKDLRDTVVCRPMSAGLIQVLVADEPDRILTVTKETLQEHKLTPDEAFAVARENLWKRSNEAFLQLTPGLYAAPWNDNYAASRIVLHDLIWQLEVRGDHVVMIPNRDTLLVTGLDNAPGLKRMGEIATQMLNSKARPFTGYLYHLDKTTWVRHTLPKDHPAYSNTHDAMIIGHAIMYESQKARLIESFKKSGEDIFVASLTVMQNTQSKALSCHSIWPPVPSFLPEADQVQLIDGDPAVKSRMATVEWAEAMAHFGAYMKPVPDSFPPRWSVNGHPPQEVIEAAGGKWREMGNGR